MRFRCLLVLALSLLAPGIARSQSPDSSACPPNLLAIPVSISARDTCPGIPARLLVTSCAPCVRLLGYAADSTGPLHVYASQDTRACLVVNCHPESLWVPLGTFAPGHFQVNVVVEGNVIQRDSSTCFASSLRTVTFDVPQACPIVPDTVPAPLPPYVTGIHVGPPELTPICPGLPIQFAIAGLFTDVCHSFREIQLLPNPSTAPGPQPPIVRVLISNKCAPCADSRVAWFGQTLLPGLPPGPYGLIVQVAEDFECDSTVVRRVLGQTVVPFTVAPECGVAPPYSCYLANWAHTLGSACDTQVSPGDSATLDFEMFATVPIAGLQGRIRLEPSSLRISDLRPAGTAAGMRVTWQQRPDGASFVMFSDDGQLISGKCPLDGPCLPAPALRVTFAAPADSQPPRVTIVRMEDLLVADSLGRGFGPCPTIVPLDLTARICAGGGVCDASGDDHIDVRDLVLMVRCLRGECTDGLRARLDCNSDSTFTLDDVLCCAQRILRGSLPDSLPPPQPLEGLIVSLGKPVPTIQGFEQTVHLQGAGGLGAARLALGYRSGWTLVGVDIRGNPSDWMHLEQQSSGHAVVGLLALAPNATSEIDAVLHFSESPRSEAGAGISSLDAEFVGADGRVVTPPDGIDGAPSTGPAKVELSAARPNPFSNEAHFVLTLSAAAPDVKLAIYDLSGRLVASLHSGALAAGSHAFVWDGRRSDGTRAADGVYFYRARTGSSVMSRRIVSMRGR